MNKIYFKVSEFTKSEIAETRGIDNTPTPEAIDNIERLIYEILNPLRIRFGSAIKVNSGFRCDALNKAVKGSKTSQHRIGAAADIKAVNGKNRELFEIAKEMIEEGEIVVGQLIWEYGDKDKPLWVHISLPYNKVNDIKYFYDE